MQVVMIISESDLLSICLLSFNKISAGNMLISRILASPCVPLPRSLPYDYQTAPAHALSRTYYDAA
jgi:hypothetical protein